MPTKQVSVAVVVLGMHRSGTSAVARALLTLGVNLGRNLMGGSPDNPKGYWENRVFVKINERLLSSLGLRWHSQQTFQQ